MGQERYSTCQTTHTNMGLRHRQCRAGTAHWLQASKKALACGPSLASEAGRGACHRSTCTRRTNRALYAIVDGIVMGDVKRVAVLRSWRVSPAATTANRSSIAMTPLAWCRNSQPKLLEADLVRERERADRAVAYGARLLMRVDSLERALCNYGAHTRECRSWHPSSKNDCSCGLADELRLLELHWKHRRGVRPR